MQEATRTGSEIASREPVIDWEEIFQMLRRQRWKIVAFGFTGLAIGVLLVLNSQIYESQSKIFVRYVQENSAVDALDRNVTDVDSQRTRILNNEVEILTSTDLAEEVALAVGPEHFALKPPTGAFLRSSWARTATSTKGKAGLPGSGAPPESQSAANAIAVWQLFAPWLHRKTEQSAANTGKSVTPKIAASLIMDGLQASPKKDSSVIHVSYRNFEPELTSQVLEELIRRYFDKHLEIHRPGGGEHVIKQTEHGEKRIQELDGEISQIMNEAGIVSTKDCLELVEKQRSQLRGDLIALEAELASAQARTKSLKPELAAHNQAETPGASASTCPAEPSEEDVRRYQMLLDLVAQLRKRNLDLIATFTPKSRLIASNSMRLDTAESERRRLAMSFPTLVSQTSLTREGANNTVVPRMEIDLELATLSGLQGKKKLLEESLLSYERYASTLPAAVSRIRNLERMRQQEEDNLAFLRTTLKKVQADAALDPSQMPNLTILQHPTPAKKVRLSLAKTGAMSLIGGLGAGFLVAFWIEIFVDRRVKRPEAFGKQLGIPLRMIIPFVSGWRRRCGNADLIRYAQNVLDLTAHESSHSKLRPRGPRLLAIMGAGKGTGASTLTECLLESLREHGEKVLLVDPRSLQHDLAHLCETGEMSIRRGKEKARRVIWERLSLKQFDTFFSNLRETDYDSVLIDMPLIGPGIPTRQIVKSLHKVLLITSPDRTDRDVLAQTYDALTDAGADIFCIFNKVPPADCRAPLASDLPPRPGPLH